ncbi:hypothetical protein GT037_004132 [Alternaria burnsii]|uniref:CCHC-type domain-containing protein n=1 Tax=Alternaria burnsii TaxID=1187904 RepID=A0A8H7BG20_9PLEO|nr:uncharacterized protein GT037_004132 [Alternaria burnsii]KAF7678751.1 hypothetical protein GT037_004132 [Alternaria burnsii]CAI9636446.1 unnamed protein product [Alternaria burnsii]
MASPLNDQATFERLMGSLSGQQRELFDKLRIRDMVLQPTVSHEERGRRNLEECQRNLDTSRQILEESQRNLQQLDRREKNIQNGIQTPSLASTKTSHQQSYEIKFGLRHDAGGVIDRMTNEEIVRCLTRNNAPFDQIQACRVHATALVLMVSNPEAEAAIHAHQHQIGPMLGIPKDDCHLLRPSFQVQIHNFRYRENGQFNRPNDFIATWSAQNEVHIVDARWTYKKLVWTLDRLGDAQKLVKNVTVWLSGYQANATAFDKRSTPKQCHTCGKPGHLKSQCPDPSKPFCLRCGRQTKEHNAWDGGCKGPECCVNCGRSHPAWSPQCQDPRMRRAREESRSYATKQVFWERFPATNSDPTTNAWLKAVQTNSRKRQRADVDENFPSRATTSAHSDTKPKDRASALPSRAPSGSWNESHMDDSSMHATSSQVASTRSSQFSLEPTQPDIAISSMSSTESLAMPTETVSQPSPQPTPPRAMAGTTALTPSPQTPSRPRTRNPYSDRSTARMPQLPGPQIQMPNEFSQRQMGPRPCIIAETPNAPSAPIKLLPSDTSKNLKIKTTRVRRLGGNNIHRARTEMPRDLHVAFHNFQRQTVNPAYD